MRIGRRQNLKSAKLGPYPAAIVARLDNEVGYDFVQESSERLPAEQREELEELVRRWWGTSRLEKADFTEAVCHARSTSAPEIFYIWLVLPTPGDAQLQPCRIAIAVPESDYARLSYNPYWARACGLFSFADDFLRVAKKGECPPARGSICPYQPDISASGLRRTQEALTAALEGKPIVFDAARPTRASADYFEALVWALPEAVRRTYILSSYSFVGEQRMQGEAKVATVRWTPNAEEWMGPQEGIPQGEAGQLLASRLAELGVDVKPPLVGDKDNMNHLSAEIDTLRRDLQELRSRGSDKPASSDAIARIVDEKLADTTIAQQIRRINLELQEISNRLTEVSKKKDGGASAALGRDQVTRSQLLGVEKKLDARIAKLDRHDDGGEQAPESRLFNARALFAFASVLLLANVWVLFEAEASQGTPPRVVRFMEESSSKQKELTSDLTGLRNRVNGLDIRRLQEELEHSRTVVDAAVAKGEEVNLRATNLAAHNEALEGKLLDFTDTSRASQEALEQIAADRKAELQDLPLTLKTELDEAVDLAQGTKRELVRTTEDAQTDREILTSLLIQLNRHATGPSELFRDYPYLPSKIDEDPVFRDYVYKPNSTYDTEILVVNRNGRKITFKNAISLLEDYEQENGAPAQLKLTNGWEAKRKHESGNRDREYEIQPPDEREPSFTELSFKFRKGKSYGIETTLLLWHVPLPAHVPDVEPLDWLVMSISSKEIGYEER